MRAQALGKLLAIKEKVLLINVSTLDRPMLKGAIFLCLFFDSEADLGL